MPYKDPQKQKEFQQVWYQKNKELTAWRTKRNHKYYRHRNKLFSERYKIFVGCKTCGYKKCSYALEFHHHNDNKKYSISEMLGQGHSMKTVKSEIRKCIVLCANCHREEHFNLKNKEILEALRSDK